MLLMDIQSILFNLEDGAALLERILQLAQALGPWLPRYDRA